MQPGEGGVLPLRGDLLPLRWQEGRYARLEIDEHGACVQWPTRAGDATLRRLLREFYEAQTRADVGRWLPSTCPPCHVPSRLRHVFAVGLAGAGRQHGTGPGTGAGAP